MQVVLNVQWQSQSLFLEFSKRMLRFQGEIQRLRDKLALAERTAKAERQLKVRFSLCNLLFFMSVHHH